MLLPLATDAVGVYEVDVEPAIAALDARQAPIPVLGTTHAHLYRTRSETSLYYLYDQAAVTLGLIAARRFVRAAELLDGLVATQLPDGSWPFVMRPDGAPYWDEGDLRPALGGDEPIVRTGLRNDCPIVQEATRHRAEVTALAGFSDITWSVGEVPRGTFVWSEGTLGYIAALDEIERKTGRDLWCAGIGADDLVASMGLVFGASGAAVVSSDAHPEYGQSPGTAALAWWLMIDGGLNPFRPWEAR
ncbi:MAG: hypothetical protein AAGF11_29535 [Myxococcota bacterium]